MGKLTGKVALVTGASKGIGAAIAVELAAEGASVVVNYSSSKAGADAVVGTITKAGGKAIAVGANVSKPEEIQGLVDAGVKAFGKLDVLVNNAGVYGFGPLEAITPADFHKHFDLNVMGLILTTQAAVKVFPASGGAVINIGSIVGSGAVPNATVYCATKGAVDSISLSLARELGPKGIRVNSINPGMVETEGVHAAGFIGSDFEKEATKANPFGRMGQPSDIAKAVALLASDDALWISGEAIRVAGGSRT